MRPSRALALSQRIILAVVVILSALVSPAVAQTPQQLHTPNVCDHRPGGPPPCKDSDGDGLCDSWEIAKRLPGGAPLPDADPNKPDIYVRYDWMGYGGTDNACASDVDCNTSLLGQGHSGETCSGPATPTTANSCAFACTTDADCTSRGPSLAVGSHAGERCIQNRCLHTHDPELIAPGALQAVVDSFGRHGINLHLVRGQELPHSHVLSLRRLEDIKPTCEGGSFAGGSAGPGKYAESFYDLKSLSFPSSESLAYHYVVFGHYNSCDTQAHCDDFLNCAIPLNPDATTKAPPPYGGSGISEVFGNDFIISLGNFINDQGHLPTRTSIGGTFMHELGHNLGLMHGGGNENGPNFKPNYLSVMNYRYQFTGILMGDAPGSAIPKSCSTDSDCTGGALCERRVCARLDYSNQALPIGGSTPGSLDENGNLDELAGLGSGTSDLFTFEDGTGCESHFAPTQGPVDWDGDGTAGDNAHASSDMTSSDTSRALSLCGTVLLKLNGHADWDSTGHGLTYSFQCTSFFADGASPSPRFMWEPPARLSGEQKTPCAKGKQQTTTVP
jgi:hypothetical protein